MNGFEEIPEVSQFFAESSSVLRQVDIEQEQLFQKMEDNFNHFAAMNMTPQGYLSKLAFISSILRDHDLQHLSVIQNFESTTLGTTEEKFTCTVVAEPYKNEINYYKPLILQRFESLKDEVNNKSNNFNNIIISKFRIKMIWQQKEKVMELFNKILIELSYDYDATAALTSFFIFEIESLSIQQSEHSLAFFDLFDLSNPFDKWFASYKIKAKYKKPSFSIGSLKITN